ncbi:TPA: helix-turn-helix transcriptional regulator [Bacillus thuringiensis]|nr:helix-turn-helix transcriptional regulator [Bacillus thuringiensis]
MSSNFNMNYNYYERSVEILELLSSSIRLLIVRELIISGTLTIPDLSATIHISENEILQHVQKLTQGKVITSERKGKRIYCRIDDQKVIDIINLLLISR